MSASGGAEGIAAAREHRPDLILLDLMMPDVNGFELLDRIERESPALMRRVIVITGAAHGYVDSLDESKIFALVRKPFDLDQLMDVTRRCTLS
jgi:CheY-like chemotaxis protein